MKKFLPLILLFVSFFSLHGDSRSFHFFGWSQDGKFSWFERGNDDQGGFYYFQIIDLVTDEILSEEKVYTHKADTADITDEIWRRYALTLDQYSIRSDQTGQTIQQDFQYLGKRYRTLLAEDGDSPALRILNLSDNSYKDVNTIGSSDWDQWSILGGLISPYEKRACLILKQPWGGHRVFGAHLTIGFTSSSYTAGELVEAVLCGQYYITRQLLGRGVPVDSSDNRGFNALLLAVRNKKWEIAELLVQQGADVTREDYEGNQPLHYAVTRGQSNLVELLCRKGASLNAENNQGETPWGLAQNDSAMLNILKKYR